MSLVALVTAAAPLFEIELRRVAQRVVEPGSLSTARTAITPLGPLLRVQSGGEAQWTLQLAGEGLLALRHDSGSQLLQLQPAARWQLQAAPTRLSEGRVHLRLAWQQTLPTGGNERWSTELTVRSGHWTVLAREQPEPAPAGLSTRPVAQVQELQVRVNELRTE